MCLFILACGIIAPLTFGARKGDNLLHQNQSVFVVDCRSAGSLTAKVITPRFGLVRQKCYVVITKVAVTYEARFVNESLPKASF